METTCPTPVAAAASSRAAPWRTPVSRSVPNGAALGAGGTCDGLLAEDSEDELNFLLRHMNRTVKLSHRQIARLAEKDL
ncbi:hypothetical protein AB0A71_01760 [Kitasatospora aureofaciens]|uniref:hypothetical protein n=1 Tax=Kitasatospora aureofaciens TaxID=1894 RepID=UPI00340F8D7B